MRVLEIASEKNPTFKTILRLAKARGIKKYGLSLLSGKRQVMEVLKEFPERCEGIILSDHKDLPHGVVQQDIPCYHLSPELFGQIDVFGTRQAVLMVSVEPLTEPVDDPWPSGCTLCVPFQDPANVGAVIRAAAAFGVSRVVLLKEAAHPYHPKSFRVAGSNLLRVPLFRGPSLAGVNRYRVPIITLSPEGKEISNYKFPPSFCLVPGLEGEGLADNLKGSDQISIPMEPGVESLNAAMATGIALYVWRSRLGK
ncbi:MAG: RNA methyltransferase [Pseudomonadota bacterium]